MIKSKNKTMRENNLVHLLAVSVSNFMKRGPDGLLRDREDGILVEKPALTKGDYKMQMCIKGH